MKIIIPIICFILITSCKKDKENANKLKNFDTEQAILDSTARAVNADADIRVAQIIELEEKGESNLKYVKDELSNEDYSDLYRIEKSLLKKGLNICKLNDELDEIASQSKEKSKDKFPNDYVKQTEYSSKIQNIARNRFLTKKSINDNDAMIVTLIFSKNTGIQFCN